MSNDFSIPPLATDGLIPNPTIRAWYNRALTNANQSQAEVLTPAPTPIVPPAEMPHASVRDARMVGAVPTPRTLPQLPASIEI